MIRIVGFCDVPGKPAGTDAITYFHPANQFTSDRPPSSQWLRRYADRLGYHPSEKKGAHSLHCDPVYVYLPGHVHEHRVELRPGEGRAVD